MKVLYLIGCLEGESKRYRVYNHIEALEMEGIFCESCYDIDSRLNTADFLNQFDIIVVFRSGDNERIKLLVEKAGNLNIPIVYDMDDLLFEPSLVSHVAAYKLMSPPEQKDYISGMHSLSKAIRLFPYVTNSTTFLQRYVYENINEATFHIPFGVNKTQIEIAQRLINWQSSIRFIGYLSGSKTHEADFAMIAPALNRILDEYDDVYLKCIGYLDIEKYLPRHINKVVNLSFMNWCDLVIETGNLYINLAPLDNSSMYNKAKSELKFSEVSLCKVPTIATPIPSYSECIRNGENGILAETLDEWYLSLKKLLDNRDYRDTMGLKAYETAEQNFFPDKIARRIKNVYSDIISIHKGEKRLEQCRYGLKRRGSGLKISWVIPQPFEGSGGHRNIFRAVKFLSERGHIMSVHCIPDGYHKKIESDLEALRFINDKFFDIKANVYSDSENIEECDVLISCYWTATYVVHKNKYKAKLLVNFIQDFEPYFFPMSSEYVMAYESYKLGLYPITSGPWPLEYLKREYGIKEGDFFRFPLDRDIYHTNGSDSQRNGNRVVFFARPDYPRRCYHLGIQALSILKARRPQTEIILYGADRSKYSDVPFKFSNLGMLPSITELGELYRNVDVGICFSTTNPSLVPYEMMACGCPVVDLDFNNSEVNYGCRDNAMLVSPTPNSIAEGIIKLLDNPELRNSIAKSGLEYSKIFPTEAEMGQMIEDYIRKEYLRVTKKEICEQPKN